MATIVDTNVLLDLFEANAAWRSWSMERLADARAEGEVIVNPIIYAEFSAGYPLQDQVDEVLPASRFHREDLPWRAAFLAGKAFLAYKRSGGVKRSPLPDFYIGAHALVAGHRLLTRDASRYRSYFPDVGLISPDTDS